MGNGDFLADLRQAFRLNGIETCIKNSLVLSRRQKNTKDEQEPLTYMSKAQVWWYAIRFDHLANRLTITFLITITQWQPSDPLWATSQQRYVFFPPLQSKSFVCWILIKITKNLEWWCNLSDVWFLSPTHVMAVVLSTYCGLMVLAFSTPQSPNGFETLVSSSEKSHRGPRTIIKMGWTQHLRSR